MAMSRRLQTVIALSLLVASVSMAAAAPVKQAAAAATPIVVVSQQIKGYASATSVLQGDSLNLYVTVNPAQTFTIDFYRVGWYGGVGGRLMGSSGPLNGAPQPACPVVD